MQVKTGALKNHFVLGAVLQKSTKCKKETIQWKSAAQKDNGAGGNSFEPHSKIPWKYPPQDNLNVP